MDVKDIKKIVELVRSNDLVEFELEDGDFRLYLRGAADAPAVTYAPQQPQMMMAPPSAAPASASAVAPAAEAAPADADAGLVNIVSPIVGTFYAASSPDSPPFVKVGDSVTEDSVVCIVEAMKVMNEIKADVKGTIRKIVVDNATPVEFGQVLFKVEPA
jgi:acetyl-CoA carboxylase biotin carboxyl carrier protein